MKQIVDGVKKFQQEVFPHQKALYEQLAGGQCPQALFIGCSDSRVIPEVFTQQGPGDLFVIRNAGNIVPPYAIAPGGTSASIEYAVSVLGVPDIVVCGHQDCGAMRALLQDEKQLEALPAVARWLHFADAALQTVTNGPQNSKAPAALDALVRANVLLQMAHLRTHPAVGRALHTGKARLHGWVYAMTTAEVLAYDEEKNAFLPLHMSTVQGTRPHATG
jgi:carbonic anhydrase